MTTACVVLLVFTVARQPATGQRRWDPNTPKLPMAKTWVAYCGVNPEPRDSGNTHYSKLSRVGMARVRASLYMPSMSAMIWNGPINALVERLKAKGKAGKLRVMAAMNKLLRQCFGVLKGGIPFNNAFNQPTIP